MAEDAMVDLKKEINNFIWMHGPGDLTLDKAETLACYILRCFTADWPAQEETKIEKSHLPTHRFA